MLDIQNMIITNDFSDLLNSTQKERDECGGNCYLFNQLTDYIHIDYIQQIVESIFKDDEKIIEYMNKYDENIAIKSLLYNERESDLYGSITLP